MKDLNSIFWFLGIQFQQTEDGIGMNQTHYINNILERFGMSECKPRFTPCEMNLEAYETVDDDDDFVDNITKYREIVGCWVYAMT